jgi:hypothetical protein
MCIRRSEALKADLRLIPKLVVRVRFPSPALELEGPPRAVRTEGKAADRPVSPPGTRIR